MTQTPVDATHQLMVAESAGFRIRGKRREDFPDDYAWRTDAETARFDGNPPLAMAYADFVRLMEQELVFGDPFRRNYSVETSGGRHIGNVMYYNVSAGRDAAEFGLSLGEEALRGHGLGTAVTVVFLRYLWQNLPFRTVYLHTLDWNTRARRCFERAGFDATATVERAAGTFIRMETRREWWLLWDAEGRFDAFEARAAGWLESASAP